MLEIILLVLLSVVGLLVTCEIGSLPVKTELVLLVGFVITIIIIAMTTHILFGG